MTTLSRFSRTSGIVLDGVLKKENYIRRKMKKKMKKQNYKYISKPYFYYTVFEIYLTVITK